MLSVWFSVCFYYCCCLHQLPIPTPVRAHARVRAHTHTPLWTSTVKKESPYYFSHASSWGQKHRKGSGNFRTNEGPPPPGRTDQICPLPGCFSHSFSKQHISQRANLILSTLLRTILKVKMLLTQSCLTLCKSMNCSPARLLCPWNSPGKNATAAKSLQSCLTLCDLVDGSPPDSGVPEILQAKTLEWAAISFSDA